MSDDILFTPLRELSDRIRRKQLSPVELTETALRRLETLGPRLNAVVTVMRDPALAEARAAEAEIVRGRWRGPLHGVPYGVKDLVATRGVPTTWGAEPYRAQVFDEDATVVTRLREAGAILTAKLAMVELAGGMGYNHADASFTGPGLTPWDTRFWSGGSSSGPGSAVAAGLVPWAVGSETSGSILTPCAFCGVTGLRPTYGLVSRHGAMALAWTLDKLGPMGRSADDCALALAAMAGPDPRDGSTVGRGFEWKEPKRPAKRLRVAVPKGVSEKEQPEVRANFERALEAMAPWCEVTREVAFPDLPWGPAISTIVNAEGAAAFIDLIEAGRVKELRCPRDRHGGYAGTQIAAVDYLQAMRLRRPMKAAMAELFRSFDVIATPTRASVAYPADRNFEEV
ncbi:MAG: amidase, partial [Solirubrobacteraceae bacterium]|nr:amidase [Solirubrobacteraceae bacterium]